MREELRQERAKSDERHKTLLLEKSELEAAWQLAREQLETVKKAREEECEEMREEVRKARERAQISGERERESREEIEERMQDVQRSKLQLESEFEKQRALFE